MQIKTIGKSVTKTADFAPILAQYVPLLTRIGHSFALFEARSSAFSPFHQL
jgi:hypothetical protein